MFENMDSSEKKSQEQKSEEQEPIGLMYKMLSAAKAYEMSTGKCFHTLVFEAVYEKLAKEGFIKIED
jgi:cupin superfamily acireductone dioxygenase involved in methionine salvage